MRTAQRLTARSTTSGCAHNAFAEPGLEGVKKVFGAILAGVPDHSGLTRSAQPGPSAIPQHNPRASLKNSCDAYYRRQLIGRHPRSDTRPPFPGRDLGARVDAQAAARSLGITLQLVAATALAEQR